MKTALQAQMGQHSGTTTLLERVEAAADGADDRITAENEGSEARTNAARAGPHVPQIYLRSPRPAADPEHFA